MIRRSRWIATAAVAPLAVAVLASGAGAKTGAPASVKNDSGIAYFSVVHTSGSSEIAAGTIQDKVLGAGALTYVLKVTNGASGTFKVTAKKVILYSAKGSLSGTATATVATSGNTQTITNGKLNLSHGQGSLKGDQLVATFTGTADLSKNLLQYKYKGTLSS
jgi:hypothetical protein